MDHIPVRGLIEITFNCSETSRETHFNRWYDEEHLPGLEKVAGVSRSARFVARPVTLGPEPEQPKYLTLLELEGVDAAAVHSAVLRRAREVQRQGEMHEALDVVSIQPWTRIAKEWRRTDGEGDRSGGHLSAGIVLVFSNSRSIDKDPDLNRWYNDMHVDDMLSTGFFHAGHRYRSSVETMPSRYDVRYQYLAIYETDLDPVSAMTGTFIVGPRWRADGRTTDALGGTSRPHWAYSRI